MNSFFEVIRGGINTTFQDDGRNNLYHIGIPFSGAMDKRNYILANSLLGNKINKPVIEFAYQGPLIKYKGDKINFVITGDVIFKIIKKEREIKGNCYENYIIEDGDQIDVISTNKSVPSLFVCSPSNVKSPPRRPPLNGWMSLQFLPTISERSCTFLPSSATAFRM